MIPKEIPEWLHQLWTEEARKAIWQITSFWNNVDRMVMSDE